MDDFEWLTNYSWGFRIGYPAIAGPPKATPAIARYLVVDFRWYHYSWYRYSAVFYPLMVRTPAIAAALGTATTADGELLHR